MEPEQVPAPGAGDEVIALILAEERSLRWFARTLTNNEADVEDLVQETLMRAYAARARFRIGTSVRAWTRTILRNVFLTGAARTKFRATVTDGEDGGPIDRAESRDLRGANHEPFNTARFTEDLDDRIVVALDRMNPVYAYAFYLSVMEDLTVSEAAELIGVPQSTVMSRVHRAREALSRALRHHPDYEAFARRCERRS